MSNMFLVEALRRAAASFACKSSCLLSLISLEKMVTAGTISPLSCPLTAADDNSSDKEEHERATQNRDEEFVSQIRWPDLAAMVYLHTGALYGLYLLFTQPSFTSFIYLFFLVYLSGLGITAGVHRLWSHRSYRAAWPLRLLLSLMFTLTGQRDIYTWALDHRVHHKYSETDADPHDARRGFWFAHIGWLFLTPTPQVVAARQQVDMRDLEQDGVVMWQKRYYLPLFALLTIALPVLLPCWLWGMPIWMSFWVNFNLRFTITLNLAFFVNSAAHMWGNRPYDQYISPSENLAVSLAALGEGFHNYHHVFPYDYKTGELGHNPNLTTGFIDLCAKLGAAWDLKSVSAEMVLRRRQRTGDLQGQPAAAAAAVWGWGDKDMPTDDVKQVIRKTS